MCLRSVLTGLCSVASWWFCCWASPTVTVSASVTTRRYSARTENSSSLNLRFWYVQNNDDHALLMKSDGMHVCPTWNIVYPLKKIKNKDHIAYFVILTCVFSDESWDSTNITWVESWQFITWVWWCDILVTDCPPLDGICTGLICINMHCASCYLNA